MTKRSPLNLPIYLISLSKDSDRRETLKNKFSGTYSSFQLVQAVDGRGLDANDYFNRSSMFYEHHGRMLLPAELGCALSHIKALEMFLESNMAHALIIEDDVIGRDSDIYFIQDCVNEFMNDDIAFCGCQEGTMNRYKYGKPIARGVLEIAHVNRYEFSRTAAYVVSREAAQCILDFHENKYITVADFWFELLKAFTGNVFYISSLSHPEDLLASNIESERYARKRRVVQKLFSSSAFSLIVRRLDKELKRAYFKLCGHINIENLR